MLPCMHREHKHIYEGVCVWVPCVTVYTISVKCDCTVPSGKEDLESLGSCRLDLPGNTRQGGVAEGAGPG